MSTYDPRLIKTRPDWAIVLDDERKTKLDSGIELTTFEVGIEKVTEWAGELVYVGVGDKTKVAGLEPGLRVVYRAFLKYANRIPTEETWSSGNPKHYFFMAVDDILAVIQPGVQVGAFSRSRKEGS